MFTIKVKKSAVKSAKELSSKEKERVREVINTIEVVPTPPIHIALHLWCNAIKCCHFYILYLFSLGER